MNTAGAESTGGIGRLRIEGQFIQRIILLDQDGKTHDFQKPEEEVSLPVGNYHWNEVWLKEGYHSYGYSRGDSEIAVKAGQSAVLKIGGPLKPVLKIQRQGTILNLDYQLEGQGGEYYSGGGTKRPEFMVYQGNRKVGSGKFEYG